jgi:hypothetical protein
LKVNPPQSVASGRAVSGEGLTSGAIISLAFGRVTSGWRFL